jgi:voltage-gated potassium channel
MTHETATHIEHSNAYNIFIVVLTIISLIIMVLMFLPLNDETLGLLQVYDNLICVIFLIDFTLNLRATPKKSDYFIKERGWLDLLGSIPSLGVAFKYSGILRLARLSRLARILRILRGQNKESLFKDVLEHRSQYTGLITILLSIIVLASASVLVLQFESQSPQASIKTGWESFWFSIVTITTVGYGDYSPVTVGGRITAMFIMIAGIGIIGVLASLMSSFLVGSPQDTEEDEISHPVTSPSIETEIAAIKKELAEMRKLLEKIAPDMNIK